jgi:hypothetical protein
LPTTSGSRSSGSGCSRGRFACRRLAAECCSRSAARRSVRQAVDRRRPLREIYLPDLIAEVEDHLLNAAVLGDDVVDSSIQTLRSSSHALVSVTNAANARAPLTRPWTGWCSSGLVGEGAISARSHRPSIRRSTAQLQASHAATCPLPAPALVQRTARESTAPAKVPTCPPGWAPAAPPVGLGSYSPQKSLTISPSPSTCGPNTSTSRRSRPASNDRVTPGLTRTASSGASSTSSSSSLTRPEPAKTT